MQQELLNLKNQALALISEAKTESEIESYRVAYLGRKGKINQLLKQIPELDDEEKGQAGALVNDVKNTIKEALEEKQKEFNLSERTEKGFDVTMPGTKPQIGHINPVTQIIWELTEAFEQMGYKIVEGPEIETEFYNFEVLNIPKNHPARDLQDTFWLSETLLPRTHTSAMQVRIMEKLKPPFKIAVPGWVYRCEREDATHASVFTHFEGFAVGKNISFANLKATLFSLMQKVLGNKTQLKFRASYFPYVEPCAEMSASCPHCQTKGCPACGNTGWLEILGSGMIHPQVLKNAKIDPEKYSGFAFCFGPSRLAMIKHQINDIRLFTSNDLRFIKQF